MLTNKEIELVKNSWSQLREPAKQFGNDLFINIFTKYPSYQKFFKSFATVPLSELRSSKRLQAHTTNIMYAVTGLVENLDDPECVTEMLVKIGENHSKRKVEIQMFDQVGVIFSDLIREKMGNQFNSQLQNAWTKAWSFIVEKIIVGYNEQNE